MANPSDQLAAVLRKQWERYQQLYTPVEDELLASLNKSNATQTAAAAEATAQRGHEATARIRERYGIAEIDPEIAQRNREIETTLAGSSAFNQTRLAEFDRRDNVRAALVGVGQGLLNQATGGLTSAAGMHASRESSYANALANYNAQQAQIAAQRSAQRSSTAGGLLSAGIIAAASFF